MLNKKSQFYFLLVLIMLSIFAAFVFKQVFMETKNHTYLYTEFSNEIYYVVNSGIYNSLPINNVLLQYFDDFFLFLKEQKLHAKLVYFINYNNSIFVYNNYPKIKLYFTNGTNQVLAYNTSEFFSSEHFKVEVDDQEYTLTLDQPFSQYYILDIY